MVRSTRAIHVISAHAEGEVGDVIVGGVLPPPGATIREQSRWIAADQSLRLRHLGCALNGGAQASIEAPGGLPDPGPYVTLGTTEGRKA